MVRSPSEVLLREQLEILSETKIHGEKWWPDPWQQEFLKSQARNDLWNKSRQIGWSFIAAAKALVNAIKIPGTTEIFISYNLDDSKEKIRYVDELWDSLPRSMRIGRKTDQVTEMGFRNGSRIISRPCKAARGKARANIYLDEIAHYQQDRKVYEGTTAAKIRGGGQMRLGSTPLGKRGIFYEIDSEEFRKYPGFERHAIPWWMSSALCIDLEAAGALAPGCPTEVRVERWGTEALKEQFGLLDLETFQQEFECAYVDEASAFIPYELIERCTDPELEVLDSLPELFETKRGFLYGGYDVGRKRNASEHVILEKIGQKLFCRYIRTLQNAPYPDQEAELTQALDMGLSRECIDATGLGNQLAEAMTTAYSTRAEGINFTMPQKELMAGEVKAQMERGNVTLPLDREFRQQIHSIKKIVTASSHIRYDTERNEKHHADKFWALALAVWAAKTGVGAPVSMVRPSSINIRRGY